MMDEKEDQLNQHISSAGLSSHFINDKNQNTQIVVSKSKAQEKGFSYSKPKNLPNPINDPRKKRTSIKSLYRKAYPFKSHQVQEPNQNIFHMKLTNEGFTQSLYYLLGAILLIAWPIILYLCLSSLLDAFQFIFSIVTSFLFALNSLYWYIYKQHLHNFSFDLNEGSLSYKTKLYEKKYTLHDFHAVQITQKYYRDLTGHQYVLSEINLVFKTTERLFLSSHLTIEDCLQDAKDLAQFLHLPLWK